MTSCVQEKTAEIIKCYSVSDRPKALKGSTRLTVRTPGTDGTMRDSLGEMQGRCGLSAATPTVQPGSANHWPAPGTTGAWLNQRDPRLIYRVTRCLFFTTKAEAADSAGKKVSDGLTSPRALTESIYNLRTKY